jgi:hypothetical protein
LSLPHLVPNLLRALLPSLRVAPRVWNDYEGYGPRRYSCDADRMPVLRRSLVPPLRVAPRIWNGYESYGPHRHTRGEQRRFAGPEQERRNGRHGERRGHVEYRDRWR